MKIDLNLTHETITLVTATLQPVYNTKAHTRRNKSTLSMALEVVRKFDLKVGRFGKAFLFDTKKKAKITLHFHEADILELLLLDQIKGIEEEYVKHKIQKLIDTLNQKLA